MNSGKIIVLVATLAGLMLPLQAVAEAPASYATCVACHGKSGEGNAALGSPALAGQQAAYLARQLKQFRDGERGAAAGDTYGAQMRAMSSGLTDAAIDELSAYWSAQPPASAPSSSGEAVSKDLVVLRTGSDYYQARCGACHGGNAGGNEALQSPNLAILDAGYIERQFKHYQSGLRGSAEGDRLGKQMRLMSNTVADPEQLRAIISYITSQPSS